MISQTDYLKWWRKNADISKSSPIAKTMQLQSLSNQHPSIWQMDIIWLSLERGCLVNTATFNSGHDTKSGVWHPFLMAIHGFPLHILVGFCSVNILTKFHTCRCNTFKDIAPLITKPYRVLVGIPSLSQIPTKTLQGFFPYRETIPYREIKSLLLIQCREKIPVGNDSLYF